MGFGEGKMLPNLSNPSQKKPGMLTAKSKVLQFALLGLILIGFLVIAANPALARPAFVSPDYVEITDGENREYVVYLMTGRNYVCGRLPDLFLIDNNDGFAQVLAVCGDPYANDAEDRSFRITIVSDGTYAVEPWKSRVAGMPLPPLRRPPPCAGRFFLDVDLANCVAEPLEVLRQLYRDRLGSFDPFVPEGSSQRELLTLIEQGFSTEFVMLLTGLIIFGVPECSGYELGIYLGKEFSANPSDPERFKVVCSSSDEDNPEFHSLHFLLFPDYTFAVEPWASRTGTIPGPELRKLPLCQLEVLFPKIAENCSNEILEDIVPQLKDLNSLRAIQ